MDGAVVGEHVVERIAAAEPAKLRPLEMQALTESGTTTSSLAYNEVSLLRQTRQAAHICIDLNGETRLDELICDGVLVSTPAGSTAARRPGKTPRAEPPVFMKMQNAGDGARRRRLQFRIAGRPISRSP